MYNTHNCDVHIVQDGLSEREACIKEKELIAFYRNNTNYRLTNMTDGGDGVSGWVVPDEVKRKHSANSKARWQDPEYRDRIIAARHQPDSVYQSAEYKNKISQLVSGANNPNYHHWWSDNQKKHLGKIRKELGLSKDENNPKATSIICLETGEVFPLIKNAMEKYQVSCEGSFSVALRERQRTAASLHWLKFQEELLDPNNRFYELLVSIAQTSKFPIICVDTKEIFLTRKDFLLKHKMGIKKFKKEYDGKITVDGNDYMYVTDYLSRMYE